MQLSIYHDLPPPLLCTLTNSTAIRCLFSSYGWYIWVKWFSTLIFSVCEPCAEFLVTGTVSTLSFSSLTDCKWEITAYFRSLPEAGTSNNTELWIPTDTKQWQQPPLITPIKSMSSEPLCLQLYLEHPSLSESLLWEGILMQYCINRN